MKNIAFRLFAATAILLLQSSFADAQGMAINTTGAVANSSAMLDVTSTTQGVLVPRMTAAQKTAITSPATGLMIFQTDGTAGFYYYTGSAWSAVGGGGSSLPSGTTGDLLYYNGSNWVSFPAGANGKVLVVQSGVPTWSSPPYNYITATSGANGAVLPSGATAVFAGGSQVYTITPSSGYNISSVTVDGSSVGVANTYTFSAVAASHTISATFVAPAIGQSYGGGIVGYILQPGDPGYNATVQHGLIVSIISLSSNATWGCYGTNTGATGTAIGTGSSNTTAILSACTTSGIAAQLCHAYSGGGYTDWYLPSKDELNQLYLNETAINSGAVAAAGSGFASASYWSSSEYNASYAWNDHFISGSQYYSSKSSTLSVRAVRAF